MKKIVFISEYMNPPYDEGIKKTVFQTWGKLNEEYEVLGICRFGFEAENLKIVNTNKLFLDKKIKNLIREFNPVSIVYFPFASATFAGILRNYVFAKFAKTANSVMIAMQPKELSNWQSLVSKLIKPNKILTPSPLLEERMRELGVETKLLPLLTNLNTFSPLKEYAAKLELRKKYKIPVSSYIITHVGHLNEGRNLESLIPLQKEGSQVIIVGSSSTPKDSLGPKSIKENLIEEGVLVLDGYIESIQEIYQLSDLYVFPVIKKNSSIGMPLSILEARACGILVLTTDFGSVNHFLGDDNGGIYYEKPENFLFRFNEIRQNDKHEVKKTDVAHLNDTFKKILKETI